MNGDYKKYTCTNGVPRSRMKTEDAEKCHLSQSLTTEDTHLEPQAKQNQLTVQIFFLITKKEFINFLKVGLLNLVWDSYFFFKRRSLGLLLSKS